MDLDINNINFFGGILSIVKKMVKNIKLIAVVF